MVPAFSARRYLLNGTLATDPWVMSISSFFNSFVGMYVAQSFCHSIIVAMIADRALKAWRVEAPEVRQRFRLIAIIFPIVSFPLYQLINPDRSSALFRLGSLFDINRWLNMEIWGLIPIGLLFLILLGFTALVFFFQEMVPVLKHTLDSSQTDEDIQLMDTGPFVGNAAKTLGIKTPDVVLIEDDEPFIFSATGKKPAIFVSSGLTKALDQGQMDASLAHEMAHIARSRRPLLIMVFILRIIMFFNPVVMVKFRRAVKDEEKICDDIAVSLTRDPAALVEALKTFYHTAAKTPEPAAGKASARDVSLEEHSHNLHLESRIRRLESGPTDARDGGTVPFIVTLLSAAMINYFIV
jgi:hypothetical protein